MKYHDALKLAQAHVDMAYQYQWRMCLHSVIVKTYGWIFQFETEEYMESGDDRERICDGRLPIAVFKSGEVWGIPSRIKLPLFIEEWEKFSSGGESKIIEGFMKMYKT